jgi:hypothetical protein
MKIVVSVQREAGDEGLSERAILLGIKDVAAKSVALLADWPQMKWMTQTKQVKARKKRDATD